MITVKRLRHGVATSDGGENKRHTLACAAHASGVMEGGRDSGWPTSWESSRKRQRKIDQDAEELLDVSGGWFTRLLSPKQRWRWIEMPTRIMSTGFLPVTDKGKMRARGRIHQYNIHRVLVAADSRYRTEQCSAVRAKSCFLIHSNVPLFTLKTGFLTAVSPS